MPTDDTRPDPLREAQRAIVRDWLDEGHETGRMEYDVLLDRLTASGAVTEGLDRARLAAALKADVTALAHLTPEDWAERRGGDPIARTINAVRDIIDSRLIEGEKGADHEDGCTGNHDCPDGCECECHAND